MKKIGINIICSKPYITLVNWIPKLAIVVSVILLMISIFMFPHLHNGFPQHINILGKVDRYGSKSSVFMFPCLPWLLGQSLRIFDKRYNSLFYTSFLMVVTLFSIVTIGNMYLEILLK